jgi:hypothetical protein
VYGAACHSDNVVINGAHVNKKNKLR